MALKDAKVHLNAGSSGGGGTIVVYDHTVPAGDIRGAAYWTEAGATTPAARKTRQAVAGFIRNQQGLAAGGDLGDGTGVLAWAIGNDTGFPAALQRPYQARVDDNGNPIAWR